MWRITSLTGVEGKKERKEVRPRLLRPVGSKRRNRVLRSEIDEIHMRSSEVASTKGRDVETHRSPERRERHRNPAINREERRSTRKGRGGGA